MDQEEYIQKIIGKTIKSIDYTSDKWGDEMLVIDFTDGASIEVKSGSASGFGALGFENFRPDRGWEWETPVKT